MRFDTMGAIMFLLIGLVLGWGIHPKYEVVYGEGAAIFQMNTWSGAIKVFRLHTSRIDAGMNQYWHLSELPLESNATSNK